MPVDEFRRFWISGNAEARDVPEQRVDRDWDRGASDMTLDSTGARSGYWDFSTDFCSSSADTGLTFDFKLACARHDFAWRNLRRLDLHWNCPGSTGETLCNTDGLAPGVLGRYWTRSNKLRHNSQFHRDMRTDCARRSFIPRRTCEGLAAAYKAAVDATA